MEETQQKVKLEGFNDESVDDPVLVDYSFSRPVSSFALDNSGATNLTFTIYSVNEKLAPIVTRVKAGRQYYGDFPEFTRVVINNPGSSSFDAEGLGVV